MKRVLVVVHYPVFGGPHNQALRLAGPLRDRGWATTVVLPAEYGNAEGLLRKGGVDVLTIPLHRLRASRDPRLHLGLLVRLVPEALAIRSIIRERAADVVQVVGLVNPHGAMAAHLAGTPVVWQLVDTRLPPPLRSAFMMPVQRLATVVMSTGTTVARAHGIKEGTAGLVPYFPPVDTKRFRPNGVAHAAWRARLRLEASNLLIGTVANVTPQKGLEQFIGVAEQLHRVLPETRFVIVGSAMPSHAAYARTIRSLIGSSKVGQMGALTILEVEGDVAGVLSSFDLFLMTSVPFSEGIPTTVLEAMATGVPVVGSNVGGMEEVFTDNEAGRLVAPSDVAAMARAVELLLRDPSARIRMSRRAREIAVTRFDMERCADVHREAYELALQTRRRQPQFRQDLP